ncbi:MAG: thiamine pyrophosphate-binding protein [Actinomycetota bacterium]|jgi:acetolactate synthase I/II/III large subunit|nr:thiamine pyrophosphate-binding protein [Actinomycetota bacterium]
MSTITGGESMARQLAEEGVTHIFGIPGVQLDYATNGLSKVRDGIRFIATRHEQTATYAADGYYRSTGRIGVGLVVPGPGVLNAGAGLVTALACSSKVLLVAGQIPSRGIGLELGMLHEVPDQSGILATLCRESTLVGDAGGVAGAIHGAMVKLGSGPGPIAVELPPDVLSGATPLAVIGHESPASPSPGDSTDLEVAAELLSEAQRPVIYCGGGAAVSGAWSELARLADTLGAPMMSSTNGRGSFDDRHPLAVLPLAGRELLQRADCVLIVGSRGLDMRSEALVVAPDAKTISLNIDPAAFGPPRQFDATIIGDALAGVAALADRLEGSPPWVHDLDDVRARAAQRLEPLEPQMSYARALRGAMPDDAVFVNELTQVGYASMMSFPVHTPRSYIYPGYQGTLGYGYPTAIGAAVGNPDRPVVSISGDGGFGYGLSELATAVNYDIPLVCVVFYDNAYGNVQRMHKNQFDGDHYGTELTNPDMVKLAEAFGMAGYRAESPEELGSTLRTAIDAREPALIGVPMGITPDPWPIIASR